MKRYASEINLIRALVDKIHFSRHAVDEMITEPFGRITPNEVKEALASGVVFEDYQRSNRPKSYLVYGQTTKGRHLHVVCAPLKKDKTLVIVTVYEPDPSKWAGYKREKP